MSFQQNIIFQPITADETLVLRSSVLRPGRNVEESRYPEDLLPTTFHLGGLINGQVVCTGTLMKDICTYFPTEISAYRLRGMATAPEFRGLQLGSRLCKKPKTCCAQEDVNYFGSTRVSRLFCFMKKMVFLIKVNYLISQHRSAQGHVQGTLKKISPDLI